MYIHQTGEYTISMQVRFYRYERKRKYKISWILGFTTKEEINKQSN